jgi:hypothetical protein
VSKDFFSGVRETCISSSAHFMHHAFKYPAFKHPGVQAPRVQSRQHSSARINSAFSQLVRIAFRSDVDVDIDCPGARQALPWCGTRNGDAMFGPASMHATYSKLKRAGNP